MADVVGYSRLMAADEEGTVAQLKANRKELIVPKQEKYHGRTVKLMGDGALMEFGSVVDAVNFAIDVQCAIKKRNEDIPQDQQISYRIGINIGDIIVDGEDILGGDVNIAARLESICEPDGVYLTEDAFHQAQNRAVVAFEALGKKNLKNIPEPISVYRVLLNSAEPGVTGTHNEKALSDFLRPIFIAAIIAIASVMVILFYRPSHEPDGKPSGNRVVTADMPSEAVIAEAKTPSPCYLLKI